MLSIPEKLLSITKPGYRINMDKLARCMGSIVLLCALTACGGGGGQEAGDQFSPAQSVDLSATTLESLSIESVDRSANLPKPGAFESGIDGATDESFEELPWASVNGAAVVNGRNADGESIDYVFLSTAVWGEGKVYYRSVQNLANVHSERWDPKGWREIPGSLRTSEKLAAAWVSGTDNTVHGRKMWIAAIDQYGKYRIASYTPIDSDGKERWGGWYEMGAAGGGERFDGPPTLVSYGNWLRLMGVSNGQLWTKSYYVPTETWSTWIRDNQISLRPSTGVAASAIEFGSGEQREEQMVLFAVNQANKIYFRRFLQAGAQPWYEVPGGGLTDITPTAAKSSREAVRVVVKDPNSTALRYQTMRSDTYVPWPGNQWSLLTNGDFDAIGSGYVGSGGPTAVWVPPTNKATASGTSVAGAGEMHVYVEGKDPFNPVYGIRFIEGAARVLKESNQGGCIGLVCPWVTTKRVVAGTMKATPTLVPQPTMPQQLVPPRPAMVSGSQVGPAALVDPIMGNVAVANVPIYGTDLMVGTCGGIKCKGRLYYREAHNPGSATALWGANGWLEVPGGLISARKPAAAAVDSTVWVAAVSADNTKVMLTKYSTLPGHIVWEPWFDITANLTLPSGAPFFDSPPSIVVGSGFVWVVVRGVDGNIWRRAFDMSNRKFDNEWYVVKPLSTPSGLVPSGGKFVLNGVTKTILVAVDNSNSLKYAYATITGSTNWLDIPGNGVSDTSPAVALSAPDRLTVVVKGKGTSSYWYQTLANSGAWNAAWTPLPGGGVFDLQTDGPSAVYHAGNYLYPANPSPSLFDPTPTLRVYGDTSLSAGNAIWATSFVGISGGSSLSMREGGWQMVPGTYIQPPAPSDPKPTQPQNPGPGQPLPPPPPIPGSPEAQIPVVTEPINQWYPVCLGSHKWTGYGYLILWTQTVYHPGENSEDAYIGASEVYGGENIDNLGPGLLIPVGGSALFWNRGSCQ